MVFRFRVLSDENDYFVRDIEVEDDINLLELHRFICKTVDFDPKEIASFFMSDRHWERGREFTLLDMSEEERDDSPVAMESVNLGQIIRKRGDRLIYMFDFMSERALFMELTGSNKADPAVKYPRVIHSGGDAPDQFDPDALIGSGSIFDDAMDEFDDFGDDDSYDDE